MGKDHQTAHYSVTEKTRTKVLQNGFEPATLRVDDHAVTELGQPRFHCFLIRTDVLIII